MADAGEIDAATQKLIDNFTLDSDSDSDSDDEPSQEVLDALQAPTALDDARLIVALIAHNRWISAAIAGALKNQLHEGPRVINDAEIPSSIKIGEAVTFHFFTSLDEYEKSDIRANKIAFIIDPVAGCAHHSTDITKVAGAGPVTVIVTGKHNLERLAQVRGVLGLHDPKHTTLYMTWNVDGSFVDQHLLFIDKCRRRVADHLAGHTYHPRVKAARAGAGAGAAGSE